MGAGLPPSENPPRPSRARESATSFPATPTWAGTHWRVTGTPNLASLVREAMMSVAIPATRPSAPCTTCRADSESEQMTIPGPPGGRPSSSDNAISMAASSASVEEPQPRPYDRRMPRWGTNTPAPPDRPFRDPSV